MMKILQLSDTHLSADPKTRIFGLVNTEETLLDVISCVQMEKPDMVLATGDLSQDGSKESYKRLKKYFNSLPCPVYAIYGNHDHKNNFDLYLLGDNVIMPQDLKTKIGNFIFLSSHKNGSDSGLLNDAELSRLDLFLQENDKCIPVIHHHFAPLGSIIDKYMLENANEFINIMRKHSKKILFCITGHVHGFHSYKIDDIQIYSSLSTCIQFAKTENLLFENMKPGYTIYNFFGDDYEALPKTI